MPHRSVLCWSGCGPRWPEVGVVLFIVTEELGWRGYLLPRLLDLGVWPALLFTGLIHGLWHAPLMVTVGMPVMSAVLYVVLVMAQGFVIGWMRLASRTVWPAVAAHTAINSVSMCGFVALADVHTATNPVSYAGGLSGVVGLVTVAGFVAILAATGQIRSRPDDPALSGRV